MFHLFKENKNLNYRISCEASTNEFKLIKYQYRSIHVSGSTKYSHYFYDSVVQDVVVSFRKCSSNYRTIY